RAIHVWDMASGALIKSLDRESVAMGYVAWSPDLSKIAANDSLLIINDQITESPAGNVVRMGGERPMGWSPDGRKLAIGGGYIHIWDAHTGAEITNFRSPGSITIVAAWSPDSRRMAVASNRGPIIVYDTQNGQQLQELLGFQEWVRAVAWSPGATMIVA